jgi:protein TonB
MRIRSQPTHASSAMRQNVVTMASVFALHGLLLWALQAGLMRHATVLMPPEPIRMEIVTPAIPPAPLPPSPQAPEREKTPPRKSEPLKAASQPSQKANSSNTETATQTVSATQTATPLAPAPAVVAPGAATPAEAPGGSPSTPTNYGAQNSNGHTAVNSQTPAPRIELPTSDADYLNNTKPAYPAQSKRLMETGRVVVRVFIGADGQASQASIKQSSGFERLDQASMEHALKWKYIPGKRDGIPQGMWFDIPFNWQLAR